MNGNFDFNRPNPGTERGMFSGQTTGVVVERDIGKGTMARARDRAALIPDLVIDAKRVANSVFAGWHGRRKRGIGENFWQFRPYVHGETLASIDWRRSARDDVIYVRDREWQAVHTVWLWVDESKSMMFRSRDAIVSKQSRGLVIALAMAELLAKSGERLGWPGLVEPFISRNAAQRIADHLVQTTSPLDFPDAGQLRSRSDIILISDFLDPLDALSASVAEMAGKGLRGHLVHVIDPAEEVFTYNGRIEFTNPETGERLIAGNAGILQSNYKQLFAARKSALRKLANKYGWSYTTHHTDRLASQALVALTVALTDTARTL